MTKVLKLICVFIVFAIVMGRSDNEQENEGMFEVGIDKLTNKILIRNDIGYVKELRPDEIYRNNGAEHRSKAFYEFAISKPGKYEVRAVADFQIADQEAMPKNVTLSSKLYELTVK